MASLAFFGTLSITSRPSLISPLPSSQQFSSSWTHQEPTRLSSTNNSVCSLCVFFSFLVRYLQQQLILGDSLHRLDKVRRDGVGQSVPLLNFLLTATRGWCHVIGLNDWIWILVSFHNFGRYLRRNNFQRAPRWAGWSRVCFCSSWRTSGTCRPRGRGAGRNEGKIICEWQHISFQE